MKRLFLFLFVSLTCFVACQVKELAPDVPVNYRRGAPGQGEVILNAYADNAPDTKTGLDANYNFVWNPGDEIKVFSAGETAKFTAINTEPSSAAKFRGTVSFIMGHDETGDISYSWAIYPYSDYAQYNEPDGISRTATITTSMWSTQMGKDGTFEDGVAVAIGRAETLDIYFKNAYSGFYLTFSRSDITSVELKSLNNESLAGTYTIGLDDSESTPTPYVKEVVSGTDKVTLYAPEGGTFKPGVRYYILTLPDVSIQTGVSFKLYRSDGYEGTYTLNSTKPFRRNLFRNLLDPVDVRVENQGTGWIKPGDNQIWYTTDDHSVCPYNVSASTGNVVVSNTYDADADKGVITFENPLTVLDDQAFYVAYSDIMSANLSRVTLPQSLQVIGESSFENCWTMVMLSMGDNVKVIGPRAFYNCQNLTSIQLPTGLEAIGEAAFSNCRSLEHVHIPESLARIPCSWPDWSQTFSDGSNPFFNTPLKSFSGKGASADGAFLTTDNGTRLVSLALRNPNQMTSCVVPQGITTLGKNSLDLSLFSSLTLPYGLVRINTRAISRCYELTELTIPPTVVYIGERAFADDASLTKIVCKCNKWVPQAVTANAFSGTNNCPIYVPLLCGAVYRQLWPEVASRIVESEFPGDNEIYYTAEEAITYNLPSGSPNVIDSSLSWYDEVTKEGIIAFNAPLTLLDNQAFQSRSSLTSIVLPESLTVIGQESFSGCRNLSSVKMGDNVTAIGGDAFYGCGSLETIDLSDNLEAVGEFAFGASGLRGINIPQSVVYLNAQWTSWPSGSVNDSGGNSFYACHSMERFSGKFASSDGAFLIDDGTLYSFAINHQTQKYNCVVPEGVEYISFDAFRNSNCSNITLPQSLVWIFGRAFFDCPDLEEINIPASVQTISGYAFGVCPSLTKVMMESNTAPNLIASAFVNSNSAVLYIPGYNSGYDSGNWASMTKVLYQADDEVWFHGTGSNLDAQYDVVKAACGQDASAAAASSWSLASVSGTDPAVPIPEGLVSSGATIGVVKFPQPVTQVVDNGLKNGNGSHQGWDETSTWLGVLDYVSLPKTVWAIGKYGLSGHAQLAPFPAYENGKNIRTIGESAFNGCRAITAAELDNINDIGANAFYGAEGMTFMLFGQYLTSLGYQFIKVNTPPAGGLTMQFVGNTPPTVAAGAFGNYPVESLTILVRSAVIADYQSAIYSPYDACIEGYN